MPILLGLVLTAPVATYAQHYPTKPIRLVAPNAPGGGSDTVARALAEKLAPALGQSVIVENRSGAGGRTAAELVARAPADGYTLFLGTASTLIMAKALYAKLAYDPVKNFAPISLVGSTAYLLITHPSVPAKTVKELVALARARRDRLNYASVGSGSPAHLAAELFQSLTAVKLVHVPYKGSSPGTLSVIQGETDLMFSNLIAAVPHLGSGRLRTLGISSLKRSTIVPDVPTIDESGVRGFNVEQFFSLVAPSGTDAAVIKRLNNEVVTRMTAPDTRRQLAAQGAEVVVSTPDELSRLLVAEIEKWTRVIREAGITPD